MRYKVTITFVSGHKQTLEGPQLDVLFDIVDQMYGRKITHWVAVQA